MELAVFLLGEVWDGGETSLSLSLLVEFRDSHEKGLVSFRVRGGGGAAGVGGGEAKADNDGPGLLAGGSGGGGQDIEGSALVILLSDNVFLGSSLLARLWGSIHALASCSGVGSLAIFHQEYDYLETWQGLRRPG